jgi:hypothetical protein
LSWPGRKKGPLSSSRPAAEVLIDADECTKLPSARRRLRAAGRNHHSIVDVTSFGEDAPVPSIGARCIHCGYLGADAFKRAVLDAKVVVYADPIRGGAAGVHVARVLQKLGIADRLKSQITLAAGGDITEVTLAQGIGALGITQISEIVGKPGTVDLGPLPAELQNDTDFVAGIPAEAKPSEAVTQFIAFLKSPTVVAAIKAKGMRVD